MKQRHGWDARGNPIVEEQAGDGSFTRQECEENTAMRRLNVSQLSLVDTRSLKAPAFMPARPKPPVAVDARTSRGAKRADGDLRKRSSLDYLRALSEEIKKKRERGER